MSVTRTDIRLLDCTLRDGGYYNGWDFEPALVSDYLKAMAQAGIDVVELGFRSFLNGGFYGAHAFTTDAFIDSIDIPEGLRIGVMVNAKDIVTHADGAKQAIDLLFQEKSRSKVELVRIAAHAREVEKLAPALERLRELGYRTGLNLMQAGEATSDRLTEVAAFASSMPVEVLYFADSLGNMTREDVTRVINAFREAWDGPLGCHTHDNISRALENSMASIDLGVSWVDATVLGMGRGPGNARMELLLLELTRTYSMAFDVTQLIDIVVRYFTPLRDRYGWGPHPFYFLSGVSGIHPTYVQDLMSDGRYQTADIVAVLKFLSQSQSASYRADSLKAALRFYTEDIEGNWSAKGWSNGRPILLVASGGSLKRHMGALEKFIEIQKPVVLSLNIHTGLKPEAVDAWIACHPVRLAMDVSRYNASRPLIVPLGALPEPLRDKLKGNRVLDFGLKVEEGKFIFGDCRCSAPSPLVAAYSLALATSAGAPKIFLAGFDGFGWGDPRQHEMIEILEQYQMSEGAVELCAITPTSYPVPQASVYDPLLH